MNKKQKMIAWISAGVAIGVVAITIPIILIVNKKSNIVKDNNDQDNSSSGNLESNKPIPSPENWFTWNNTEITGLSSEGIVQKEIVLPNKTTSIAIDAFKDKSILENIDMSLTEITYLPDGDANTGLFYGFTNLKKITLPTKLKT